jgi:large subunit ribosomal protein L18e
MKITGRTDPNKRSLIESIKKAGSKHDAQIWKRLGSELSKANRKRVSVNLSHINRISNAGDTIVVPGKVLGAGTLNHKISIAAESFSESAREKIALSGGQCLSYYELIENNPTGKDVRFLM